MTAVAQVSDDLTRIAHAVGSLVSVDLFTAMARVDWAAVARRAVLQLEEGGHVAAETVIDLACAGVVPDDPDADWWLTPLGRLVARSVGHPSLDTVTTAEAAAMLGVSDRRVRQLAVAGQLERDGEGITVASVRARLWA